MEEIDPNIDVNVEVHPGYPGRTINLQDHAQVDLEQVGTGPSSALNLVNDSTQAGSGVDLEAEAEAGAGARPRTTSSEIDPSLQPTISTSVSTSKSTPRNPIPIPRPDEIDQDPPDPVPQPPSPNSHRTQLDASHLRQSAMASRYTRNKLLEENNRLQADLRGLARMGVPGAGVLGTGGVQQEALGEDGDGDEDEDESGGRSLMKIMEDSLRAEIEELKSQLGERAGSSEMGTTISRDPILGSAEKAVLDPESTSTSTSTLYTLITHLTSSLHTQTAHLSKLESELKQLVWEDTVAHRASGSFSPTRALESGGGGGEWIPKRDRGRLWMTVPAASLGVDKRGSQRTSKDPLDLGLGAGDDMASPEDEEVLDLGTQLEREEKEMLNGPEQTELEKALLDLRGYAEVAAQLWHEENRLPDASNYLNPVYPVFALPYVPKRIYGPRRGRVPVNVGKKEIPTELRRLIARRAKGKNVDYSPTVELGEGSSKGVAEGSRSGIREEEERGGSSVSMEDRGHSQEDTYLDDYLKGRKRLALDPMPSESRLPKKRGRPTLLDMRRKGLEPTIFETLANNSESNSRGTNVNGLGSGMASGLFSDEFIYPDPPPGTPAWDPSNLQFHTQVPYQIQMARQEYASRLARSFVASVPGVAESEEMGDYLPEVVNERPRSSSSAPRQDGVPDFSLEDLQRNGMFDNDFSSAQPRSQTARVQADEDVENAAAFNKMQNLSVREVTCENCGRTGTSVWRKLSVGRYDAKRTYRVCNPCGLHYTKNLVMRPKDNWGDVNKAPRKRRPAKPKVAAASSAAVHEDEPSLQQQQIDGQRLGLGPEGTLQMVDMDMTDHIT